MSAPGSMTLSEQSGKQLLSLLRLDLSRLLAPSLPVLGWPRNKKPGKPSSQTFSV